MDPDAVRYVHQEVDALAEKIESIRVRCASCSTMAEYAPSGMRLTVLSTIGCYYEFFCSTCRSYNKHPLELDYATALHDCGVLTRVLEVPAELAEHPDPANVRPLAEADLKSFLKQLDEMENVSE